MKKRITVIVPGCVTPTKVRRSLPLDSSVEQVRSTISEIFKNSVAFGALTAEDVTALLDSPTRSLKINDFNYRWSVKES